MVSCTVCYVVVGQIVVCSHVVMHAPSIAASMKKMICNTTQSEQQLL